MMGFPSNLISIRFTVALSLCLQVKCFKIVGKTVSNSYHTRAARYIYIYNIYNVFVDKKNLNRTLAIDSRFQTFAVGLLIKFID